MKIELQELIDFCSQKADTEISFPFGDVPICFKYKGRIFIEIYPDDSNYKITVRCDPSVGEYYRERYQGIVIPGYHVPVRQRKYKNTVLLSKDIAKDLIFEMIEHSYDTLR
jgi:predicted DNA-binding protein (MmcQ/YjbR family)